MPKQKINNAVSSMTSDVELSAQVSDRVQIRHVILAESVVRRRADCSEPPSELSLRVEVKTEASKQDQLLLVFPRFTLTGRDGTKSSEETLRIEALFVVKYQLTRHDGLKKSHFDAFGKVNGVFNVWPYWREYVQSVTVRMGLPPLTIPVFRPLSGGVSQLTKEHSSRTKSNSITRRRPASLSTR